MEYIDTPKKEGYVFSHWSKYKPGTFVKARDSKGNIIGIKNECPPFDFSREVITNDMKLYAVYIPQVTATFVDASDDTEKVLFTETTVPGKRLYDPLKEKEFQEDQTGNKACEPSERNIYSDNVIYDR